METRIAYPTLLLIVFLEGFVTISAEVLTIRQLLPIVGSSVVVTSLIIGIFLLFLAYGYRRGGQYVTGFLPILRRNFMIAAFLIGLGLSYPFILMFFYVGFGTVKLHILIYLSVYLLCIVAPMVYLLGQTVPITMNLMKKTQTVGEAGGNILHISTVGSFMGAVLTSLILMMYLGVAWTVTINSIILFILIGFMWQDTEHKPLLAGLIIVGLGVIYMFNIRFEIDSFLKTNSYANYNLVEEYTLHDNRSGKIFDINLTAGSFLDNNNQGFEYLEKIKQILFRDLALTNESILVLGAGGFTFSADGTNGNQVTYVDIDPQIEKVAKQGFIDEVKGKFIAKDARQYLQQTNKQYAAIILDAYSSPRSIPSHLATKEFFQLVAKRLQPKGVALLNVISNPTLQDDYSRRLDNTIRSAFGRCLADPVRYLNKASNIVYVCWNATEIDFQDIYTDNMNKVTLDNFKFQVD